MQESEPANVGSQSRSIAVATDRTCLSAVLFDENAVHYEG